MASTASDTNREFLLAFPINHSGLYTVVIQRIEGENVSELPIDSTSSASTAYIVG